MCVCVYVCVFLHSVLYLHVCLKAGKAFFASCLSCLPAPPVPVSSLAAVHTRVHELSAEAACSCLLTHLPVKQMQKIIFLHFVIICWECCAVLPLCPANSRLALLTGLELHNAHLFRLKMTELVPVEGSELRLKIIIMLRPLGVSQ